jgi:hypothetical protein
MPGQDRPVVLLLLVQPGRVETARSDTCVRDRAVVDAGEDALNLPLLHRLRERVMPLAAALRLY